MNERRVEVQIVNAFVQDGAGGNPAAVVVDADLLADADRQAIAARVGLSETAFVSASAIADIRLDFFTPNRRIAHCGHATIATFAHLAATGRLAPGMRSKETVDGPRRVELADGMAFMQQLAPRYTEIDPAPTLRALSLAPGQADVGPVRVDTGNGFVLIGVRRAADLAGLVPDLAALERISEALDLVGFYVFTRDGLAGEAVAAARMFAPRYGIAEEAATGMAAGPLGCLLHDRLGLDRDRLVIEQGRFMAQPSPSRLEVRLDRGAGRIVGLMVGGAARAVERLEVSW